MAVTGPCATRRNKPMAPFGLPAQYRLRRRADFERVYRGRASAADGILRVLACLGEQPHARLGLAVSRKVGSAVVRNRAKRRLREAFRHIRAELPPLDMVVIPLARRVPPAKSRQKKSPKQTAAQRARAGAADRAPPAEPTLDELRDSLLRLAARLHKRLTRSDTS